MQRAIAFTSLLSRRMYSSGRVSGKVKFFNSGRGYGFIERQDGQPDVFVHQSEIKKDGFRSLRLGEEVEFDLKKKDGSDLFIASNVTGPQGAPVIGLSKVEYHRIRLAGDRKKKTDDVQNM